MKTWNPKKSKKLCVDTVLHTKLKNFGLNPNNWELARSNKQNDYVIINKKSRSFRLIGVPSLKDKKNPTWKDIQILSV